MMEPIKHERRAIASLDGLRAISCLVVMIAHMRLPVLSRFGLLGVRVFFVISGFLITSLLLREYQQSGSLNLRRFYVRRTLRIFPAYYAYLLVLALSLTLGIMSIHPKPPWLLELTYTSNFAHIQPWVVGHTWSLSVEEQFYLAWPVIFLYFGPRKALRFLFVVLLALPLMRVCFYFLHVDTFLLCHDYLAMGCVLALLSQNLAVDVRWQRLMASKWTALLGALAVAIHGAFALSYRWWFAADILVMQTLNALLLAIFLAWCVHNPATAFGRLLNLGPIKRLGVLSYSLYLWHVLFIRPESPWSVGMAVALSFMAAIGCHLAVERPFLSLRGRLYTMRNRRAGAAVLT